MNTAAVSLAKQQLIIAKRQIARSNIEATKANYQQALYQLNHTIIRAPNHGLITNFYLQSLCLYSGYYHYYASLRERN